MADIKKEILACFPKGCGKYSRDIVDQLRHHGEAKVRSALTEMRQRGILGYKSGPYGFWYVSRLWERE